jgi:hypothetical protein
VIRAVCALVALSHRAFLRGVHYVSRGVHYVSRGCVQYGHGVYVFTEDLVIVGPPRAALAAALAEWVRNQPDAAPVTGTNPDPAELGEGGRAS